MAGRSVATCYGQRNYCTRKVFSNTGGSASTQFCSSLKVGGCYNLISFLDYSVSCDQQHPRLDKSQNFMTLISSALHEFFLPKVQEMQSNIYKVFLCGKRHAEAFVWLVHELVTSFAILFAT